MRAEDGIDCPFLMVTETPGSGDAVCVVNAATVKFSLTTGVEAYTINDEYSDYEPALGGDSSKGFITKRRNFF